MAILKHVKLTWNGSVYDVAVTMALINRIEENVNLMRLATRLQSADPPLSQVAVVFAHLLNAGGCKVTDAEVWTGMFQGGEQTPIQVIEAATAALACVFPDFKVKALEGAAPAKKKQEATTSRTRGKNSTA